MRGRRQEVVLLAGTPRVLLLHGVLPTATERRDIKRSPSITTDFGEVGRVQSIHFYLLTLLNI
jgi:hypothetical protein